MQVGAVPRICVQSQPSVYSGPSKKYSTKVWPYRSNAYEMEHDTGLFGAIVVVNPLFVVSKQQGELAEPCDIDEEVFLTIAEISESHSL